MLVSRIFARHGLVCSQQIPFLSQVSDRMTQSPKILHPGDAVDDAIQTLVALGVSGAPVVGDDGMTLLGVVSAFDFLQKEAFEGVLLDIEGSSEQVTSYINAAKRIIGQKVEDLMTVNPRTVSPNTPMRIAAEIMATERMHHLPVVDDHGHLVGILTPSDVMKDLVHVVRNLPAAPEDEVVEANISS
jgi:CBS domain-containing protein